MPELERLQINIDADASGAKRGAAEAKEAMQGLGTTTKQAVGTVERSMSGVTRGVNRLRSMLGLADKSAQGMGKNITAQMSRLERVHEAQSAKAEALRASLQRLKAELATAQRKASSTGSAKYAKLAGTLNEKYASKELQYQNLVTQIDKTAQKIWDLEDAAGKAGEQMEEMGRKAERGSGRSKTIFGSIGRSLRSMLIITAVSRGVANFIGWLGRVVAADSQVSASLAAVRQNLLTAFAPIYNAVLPAIQTLVGWLVTATQAISNFINALFGMTGKQATSIANKIGGIGGAAGGSAKQVNELLASFDELNKLGSGGGSGGGGGGGGSGGGGGGGIGGIGGDAVDSSIETINKGGLQAANILGGLTQKVTTYGAALFGLSKINRWAIAQGFGGLSKGAFAKTLGWAGLALDAGISGVNIARSDWFAGKKNAWRDALTANGSTVLGKIGATYGIANQFLFGTLGGMGTSLFGLSGSEAMPIFEENMARITSALGSELQKSYDRIQSTAVKSWGDMSIMDMVAWTLSGGWKNGGQGGGTPRFVGEQITAIDSLTNDLSARIRAGATHVRGTIENAGRDISTSITRAVETIRNGAGGEASIFRGAGRGDFPGFGQYLAGYITIDEIEIQTKINRLQDIARAVRQGIDNAEAIINKSMESKNLAKESGEMPLGMNSASVAEWATGTAGTGDKADRQNTATDLANAVANILQGTSINVDGKKLGELTVKAINKNARTAGRVDYVY